MVTPSEEIKRLFKIEEQQGAEFAAALQAGSHSFSFNGRIIHILSHDFLNINIKSSNAAALSSHIVQAFSKGHIVIEGIAQESDIAHKQRFLIASPNGKATIETLFKNRISHTDTASLSSSEDTSTIFSTNQLDSNFSIEEISEEQIKEIEEELAASENQALPKEENIAAKTRTNSSSKKQKKAATSFFDRTESPALVQAKRAEVQLSSTAAEIAQALSEERRKAEAYRKEDDVKVEKASQLKKDHFRKEDLKRAVVQREQARH